MKDSKDKSAADMLRPNKTSRQSRYRENKEAEGFRQVALWIHRKSEQAGAEAAAKGEPCTPEVPPHDLVSWVVGWARKKVSEVSDK
jgi:hypothetical protein